MVVSVKASKANPYINLFEEQANGFLKKSKEGSFTQRQNAPKAWEFNGAICFINIQSLMLKPISEFDKVKRYVMNEEGSVDVDNITDLQFVRILIKKIS